jgi:hypothetical protein
MLCCCAAVTFPLFVPEENFRYGSFTYTEDGNKRPENGFHDMGVVDGKNSDSETTSDYDPRNGCPEHSGL